MSCGTTCCATAGPCGEACTPMDKKFKLFYFNGRGKGEAVRYNFIYAKVPFEDKRMEQAEWSKIKPTTPVGQVPVLEITESNGTVHMICQSGTLVRQSANWFGLVGKKPCEMAHCDEAYECLRDVYDAAAKGAWEQDAAKKEEFFKTLHNDVIPRNFAYLERRIKENGGKNVAGGDSYTYADLTLASLLDSLSRNKLIHWSEIESKYPGMIAIKKAIEETPDIKAYLAKRPETPF